VKCRRLIGFIFLGCVERLAELKLGAAHDEGSKEIEGVGGVGCGQIGQLFVDELVGLGRDFGANQCGLENVKGDILSGCIRVGLSSRTCGDVGSEKSFGVFGARSVGGYGLICG
jgi:hypothetical protein